MFLVKKPRKTSTLQKGSLWKITYKIRPDEVATYEPEESSSVDWIPNNISGYVIDHNLIPTAGGYFLEITAVENKYQY